SAIYYLIAKRYALTDFDVRRRFVLSGGYQLPFGRGKRFGSSWNRFLNGIAGGWEGYWIMTLSDGAPASVFDAQGRFPDRVCNGNLPPSQRRPDHWFHFTCF